MPGLELLSSSQQVAAHLKRELWRYSENGELMGTAALAEQLGVNHKAVHDALHQLENEGILAHSGPRRRRKVLSESSPTTPSLQVTILLCDREDIHVDYIVNLQHQLSTSGHHVVYAKQTLNEIRMDVKRIRSLVANSKPSAWIIIAGSRSILEWFSTQPFPAFALFGRRNGLPIAGIGPDKITPTINATRRLIELGHQRISMISREARRLPTPGSAELAFLHELQKHGIQTSDYNLPEWAESIHGLHQRLESMFQYTPPTALIVDEAPVYLGAQQWLLQKGIRIPEHLSLVCTDNDPYFEWQQPSVAHIAWDSPPVIHRIIRWANRISRGIKDTRQNMTRAKFIEGGSIGPAPRLP